MRRRQFIALLGGAAAVWPLAARAQQPGMPVVGFLSGRAADEATSVVTAFLGGLNEAGFVEGRNADIDIVGRSDNLIDYPNMVTELICRKVAVIVATGGDLSALAAKAATTTIPIVF